jgi:hypothetical protein
MSNYYRKILYFLLVDWFVMSLLPSMEKYVSLSREVVEEEVIIKSHHMDLVYS